MSDNETTIHQSHSISATRSTFQVPQYTLDRRALKTAKQEVMSKAEDKTRKKHKDRINKMGVQLGTIYERQQHLSLNVSDR